MTAIEDYLTALSAKSQQDMLPVPVLQTKPHKSTGRNTNVTAATCMDLLWPWDCFHLSTYHQPYKRVKDYGLSRTTSCSVDHLTSLRHRGS
ncbi:hypothetical protein E2C01_000444 [Portunus trituberculatus]|uniref:Uncharacterized protein n=1 Tax=Portunus trituberculatus TaxID=210409 RepID=A0A5B7CHG2_PORTR|nr:hypothetical protein [Portunus trituberculatus]